MRAVLAGRPADGKALLAAFLLDLAYLAAAVGFARAMFGTFRRRAFVTRYM